jgi:hypothetical protein
VVGWAEDGFLVGGLRVRKGVVGGGGTVSGWGMERDARDEKG